MKLLMDKLENKQAIDFTNVEIPLQLNYLIGNETNKKIVHSLGLGYNFVFYINKPNRVERYFVSPGGGSTTFYDGVVFENYFMNLEAYINFRLSKRPRTQLLTFKTSYSFTNLLANHQSYNPYNTALKGMRTISFGLCFQIR